MIKKTPDIMVIENVAELPNRSVDTLRRIPKHRPPANSPSSSHSAAPMDEHCMVAPSNPRHDPPNGGQVCPMPTRVLLSQKEAAAWLGVSVDTFRNFQIPHYDLGERCKRWHMDEIISFVQTRRRDSARTPATQGKEKGRKCVFIRGKARQIGGSRGTTRTESEIAEVLELPIKS